MKTKLTMNDHCRKRFWLCAALLSLPATLIGAPALAQREDVEVTEPEHPAVLAILETNPTTPSECAQAAQTLADLERPELARKFIKKILAARLTPELYIELAKHFGTTTFTQMGSNADLAPEGKRLSDAVLNAVNNYLQDPKRITAMITQLQDPAEEKQAKAFMALREARGAAIGQLVAVLADASLAKEHPMVRAVLVQMKSEAVDPLLGILERSDPRLMVQAILVLREMRALKTPIYLLGPYTSDKSDKNVRAAARAALLRMVGHLPTREEAVRILMDRAKDYYDRGQAIDRVVDGNVRMWSWNQGEQKCIVTVVPVETARRMIAARFARDAFALNKDNHDAKMLYLATMLEVAALEAGLDAPFEEGEGTATAEAVTFGMPTMERLLEYAMKNDHPVAGMMAARILGRHGDAEELLRRRPEPCPLVRAIRSPDRRLRLAAVDAVFRLQPAWPFAGSSYIPEALKFFAATGGSPRAIVAGPRTGESRELAGVLAAMGYQVETAVNGRELVRKACASPDYELAMIDTGIENPRLGETLQQLRKETGSADLRVGILARHGHLPRAQRLAGRDPLAMAFSRPHDQAAIEWQVEQLKTLAPERFVRHKQRQVQAAEALQRLAELGEPENRFYDLRSAEKAVLTALNTMELSNKASEVLAKTGTPESQRVLVEFASRWTLPVDARKAAVKALKRSIKKHGLLLTTDEIWRQYERYEQSKDLDEDTQYIRSLILDAIELPTLAVRRAQEIKKPKK